MERSMEIHGNAPKSHIFGSRWLDTAGWRICQCSTWVPDHTLRYRAYRPLQLQTAALESPRGLQPKMHRSLVLQRKLKGKSKSGSFTKSSLTPKIQYVFCLHLTSAEHWKRASFWHSRAFLKASFPILGCIKLSELRDVHGLGLRESNGAFSASIHVTHLAFPHASREINVCEALWSIVQHYAALCWFMKPYVSATISGLGQTHHWNRGRAACGSGTWRLLPSLCCVCQCFDLPCAPSKGRERRPGNPMPAFFIEFPAIHT